MCSLELRQLRPVLHLTCFAYSPVLGSSEQWNVSLYYTNGTKYFTELWTDSISRACVIKQSRYFILFGIPLDMLSYWILF